jgi:hypothetical protein
MRKVSNTTCTPWYLPFQEGAMTLCDPWQAIQVPFLPKVTNICNQKLPTNIGLTIFVTSTFLSLPKSFGRASFFANLPI